MKSYVGTLALFLATACGNADETHLSPPQAGPQEAAVAPTPQPFVITVESAGERGFRVTLPDGTAYDDPEDYAAAIPDIEAAAGPQRIVFVLGEREAAELAAALPAAQSDAPESPLGTASQPLTAAGEYALPFGFGFTYAVDEGQFVGGCVNAAAYPGGSLRMERYGFALWELQLGRYRRAGATCLGIYERRSGYTRCGCGPQFPELPTEVRDGLVRAGVSAVTAWVIAKAVAPVMAGAMAVAL